jgi:cephalosporin hydroxylase
MGLEAEYHALCATPSDVQLHLPRFVALVAELQARHVIELGTRDGVSTIAWLYALERTSGRLTSIDIDPPPDIGPYPHWTFLRGDDCDPQVISQLEPADIVFIDTSHHYDHTRRELKLYHPLVRRGGRIVLHDTELRRPDGARRWPAFPVKKAIVEFCERAGYEWMNVSECWGLGIICVGRL